MLSFKDFLLEMVWLRRPDNKPFYRPRLGNLEGEKISDMPTGHELYKHEKSFTWPSPWIETTYSMWNPQKRRIDAQVIGKHSGSNFKVDMANKLKDAGFSAKELYKHLILHHGMTILSGDTHSMGSKNLWQRLMREPDLEVYGYDLSSQKKVPRRKIYVPAEDQQGIFGRLRRSATTIHCGDNHVFLARKKERS